MNIKNDKNKVFVIAEVANSHQGDLKYFLKLIDQVAKIKPDAIKFQKFYADELLDKNHEKYELFKELEFSEKQWQKIITYTKTKKLTIFVDIFGIKSAKEISKMKINGYKIHSSDLVNPEILQYLSSKSEPVIITLAGGKLNEIDEAIKILSKKKKEIIIMYGHQGYPTKMEDLNLDKIDQIKKRYDEIIGISDHSDANLEISQIIPLLAISKGVKVVEKHITLDRNDKRIDYQSALNPTEFKNMIKLIRDSEKILANTKNEMNKSEIEYRDKHKKKTISKKVLKQNTKISKKLFEYKRTDSKTSSISYFDFEGKILAKNMKKGDILTKKMIKEPHKIAAVIACRVGSDRLYAKPLQYVGKENILELQLRQLKKSKYIKDIVLAISQNPGNEVFVEFAKKNKIKFVCGDDKNVLSRLIIGANFVDADTILRITSENPFIFWEGIDNLIENHLKKHNDLTTYSGLPLGSSMELIKKEALEISHKKGKNKHRSELCTLFINENPSNFKISRLKVTDKLNRPDIRLTVDTPQDLWVVRLIFQNLSKNNKLLKLGSIIKFLDKNQEIKKINSKLSIEYKRFN